MRRRFQVREGGSKRLWPSLSPYDGLNSTVPTAAGYKSVGIFSAQRIRPPTYCAYLGRLLTPPNRCRGAEIFGADRLRRATAADGSTQSRPNESDRSDWLSSQPPKRPTRPLTRVHETENKSNKENQNEEREMTRKMTRKTLARMKQRKKNQRLKFAFSCLCFHFQESTYQLMFPLLRLESVNAMRPSRQKETSPQQRTRTRKR